MESSFEVTKDTIISEVLCRCPKAAAVFEKFNMNCKECMGASIETVLEGAMMHDIDINEMMEELKKCFNLKEL